MITRKRQVPGRNPCPPWLTESPLVDTVAPVATAIVSAGKSTHTSVHPVLNKEAKRLHQDRKADLSPDNSHPMRKIYINKRNVFGVKKKGTVRVSVLQS